MSKTYQITEYGSFVSEASVSGCVTLPKATFEQLENFVLSNRNRDADALELMGLSARKGIGKIITAKNYIGIIKMNDGTIIEILPKINSKVEADEDDVKKLIVRMLKELTNSPYKSVQTAHVNIEKMTLFEIFIRMFVDEVFAIVKRGLKSDYEVIQSNEGVIKGKIVFREQIRRNIAHKERTFVEYDEYTTNRAENKLIRSTLDYLYLRTSSIKNKADLKTLLNAFSEVDSSKDVEGDFSKCKKDRNTRDYDTALLWCRVFLSGKSFTSFEGSEIAFALLFPMETLFESYIAAKLRKLLPTGEFYFSAQDRKYHLFDEPSKRFLMKPDIVITRKSDNAIFVMDTKWKLLSESKPNYGISQPDMYQMYAYQKKYNSSSVTLIYPQTSEVAPEKEIEYRSGDGVTVRVRFVDLFGLTDSLQSLVSFLNEKEHTP